MSRRFLPAIGLLIGRVALAQATWVVSSTPTVDIKDLGPDGQVSFQFPVGATRFGDGTILIADRGTSSLRLISREGRLLRTIGRRGSGPGEFQLIASAARCGPDSLVVWDRAAHRASVVARGGTIGRQVVLTGTGGARGPNFELACRADGGFAYLGAITWPQRMAPGVMEAHANVFTSDPRGTIRGPLVPADYAVELVGVVGPTGSSSSFPRPLGRTAIVAATSCFIVIGSTGSDSLRLMSYHSRRSCPSDRWLKVPGGPRPVTRRDFDRAADLIASKAPSQRFADTAVVQLKKAGMPSHGPYFSQLLTDPDGRIWLQTSTEGAATTQFVVLDVSGKTVARVSIPRQVVVYEAGVDYLLAQFTDDDDAVHVGLFSVNAGAR